MLNSVSVVDDEAPIPQAVEQWLTLSGFEVQVFARAAECLARMPEPFPRVAPPAVRVPALRGPSVHARPLPAVP
ncbi:sigma-54-dependent Fis family transcriptional regulator, partial [Pseudomonas syringae]